MRFGRQPKDGSPLCELVAVTKHFGGTVACRAVDFEVRPGEVHALMGENGAGKSTLMKILHGVYHADGGEVRIGGEPVSLQSPREAERRGIAMIPQELDLFPYLSIAENLYIGRPRPRTKWGAFDWQEMNSSAAEGLARLGVQFDVAGDLRDLSAANAQLVAISRALFWSAQVVIMDEPTAALTHQEAERLFRIIRELKTRGVGIVYVSHRLEEVFAIADRITVLRDGQRVHTGLTREFDTNKLIQLMVGRPLEELFAHTPHKAREVALEVKSASRSEEFSEVTFRLRRGEIVGLGGLIGAGRSELAQAIFGISPLESGEVLIHGKKIEVHSVKDAMRVGIAYLPEERKSQGLLASFSIKANVSYSSLDKLASFGFVNEKKEEELAGRFRDLFTIRGGTLTSPVESLSGGNQQKVVISKVLALEPEIILLDEPTRGVDVGAKSEIYRIIDELAKEGKAILLISSEMNELLAMADRVLVMHEGTLTGEYSREEFSAEKIAAAAAGVGLRPEATQFDRLKRARKKKAQSGSRGAGYLGRLLTLAQGPPLIFLTLLLGLLSVSTPGFSSSANLRSIIDQVAVVGIVALAVNMVILSGEIDVSVGSLLAVCAFVYGNVALFVGGSLVPLGASLVVGGVLGAVNGLLVTRARVPSIIATLGTLLAWRGAVLLYGADQVINLSPASRVFGLGGFSGVSISAWVLFLMFALFWLLGRHSTWGREVFAVGGNLQAAHLAGLPVSDVKLGCFIASGLACGLASAVFIGQIGQLQATAATGFELRVIAAVVLGGTSISGGRGSALAPIVGAVFVGVILNGMTLNRVPGSWEQLVVGFLILVAISFDSIRNRLLSKP
jgi:ABC-type sugar transport system ATPase subunit/ribose/xylose/arabinose/galactoside ABC-type transport system permease subunit